jgi:hypothetical protein
MSLRFLGLMFFITSRVSAQQNDSIVVHHFFHEEFTAGKSYDWLHYLCSRIGARLSGSPQAAVAVEWSATIMKESGFDTVWLQPVMVPHWVRGDREISWMLEGKQKIPLRICALGNSVGTGPKGVSAQVVEVKSLAELRTLGKERLQGKIVFFNRPFEQAVLTGGEAYGGAVDQRGHGPAEAARFGAVGVVVRSMTHQVDEFPHTGATNYNDSFPKIPACAISTFDADRLSAALKKDAALRFYFRQTCQMLPDVQSYNVIGEIRGTEKPHEIILIGGHLDSWDLATGAHDDGAGCVESMEAARLFKATGIAPKRTIRVVLFMNEENGLKGALKYAAIARERNEHHVAAIETDAGGFMPRSIGASVETHAAAKVQSWQSLLAPYGIQTITNEGGGADIGPLKKQGVALFGFHPDSQRYFDYHHTAIDTFDKVNKRELQFGVVSLAGLLWLISEYGL